MIVRKKIWKEYFDKVGSGKKRFELRLADFEINEGDTLVLEEWDKNKKEYTGRKIETLVTYVLKTKKTAFWPEEKIQKYGWQIIQIEPKTKFPRGIEIVSGAIIQKDGKILLTKSPKWSNKWTLPGGHLEPGESILEGAKRETEEETGLKLKPVKILTFGELIDSKDFYRPSHFIYFDCIFDFIGGKLKLQKDELTESKWLKAEEALKLELAESYLETLQKYLEFLKGTK